ncbi:MAG: class I SAM-dependent methyltransferase [Nannocystaceae bacterium]
MSHGNRQKHESKNPIQRALIRRFSAAMVAMVARVKPRTIIDVGCGEGYMLRALVDAGVDAELWGLDLSETAIADAKARLGDRAHLEVRDAHELAAIGQRFDLVMMLEVLEHIPEPSKILPLLGQLSRGHILVSVPWEPYFRGLNFVRGKNLAAFGNDPEHVNHWGRGSFRRFLEARYTVLEMPGVFPWVMALASTDAPA